MNDTIRFIYIWLDSGWVGPHGFLLSVVASSELTMLLTLKKKKIKKS